MKDSVKEIRYCQKGFWLRYRILLIVLFIIMLLCISALAENWDGRGRYMIPPIPTIVGILILSITLFVQHRLVKYSVGLSESGLEISKYKKTELLQWDSIRNIRHQAEGLDLTFGNVFLSRFVVFEASGKEVEIPTHRLVNGENLYNDFSAFYFSS